MSRRTTIAEAVVAELNAAVAAEKFGASVSFTAVRKYAPSYEPRDLRDLTVTVVPGPYGEDLASRSEVDREVTVMVGIQQRVDGSDNADLDPLADLVEAICDYLRTCPLSAVADAQWIRTDNEVPYIWDHLNSNNVFTSFVAITYQVSDDLES